eukprot:g11487.t1
MDFFYKELVTEKLRYFQDQGGQDHIFLWSSETYDFPSWVDYIADSLFLSVEAVPIECTDFDFFSEETADNFGAHCQHCHWCFTRWKDYEKWSIEKMRDLEKSHEERTFTACYHGADSDALAIYKYANTTVRNDLQTLNGRANFSIGYRFTRITDRTRSTAGAKRRPDSGSRKQEYFERIGECHFCFAPKGLGYWSNRLYEVLFAGCIPVILSDHIGLPFDDFLDWSTFSLKWPMSEVGPVLAEHLELLLQNQNDLVKRMHENVRRNRCWFDYNSEDLDTCRHRLLGRLGTDRGRGRFLAMQVCLETKLPKDALAAFKVGTERKQTMLEVGQPRKVEMAAPNKCSVTVLKSLGSGEVPVPKGAQGETKLQVTKPDGSKAEVRLQTKPLPSKAAEYAGKEKANDVVQALLSEVLQKQPAEPYAFMLERLKASKDGGNLTTASWLVSSFVKDQLMSQMT